MKSVFQTDKGRIRTHNEDSGGVFTNQNNDRLAIVADGMGGHNAGDIASHMTIEQMKNYWSQLSEIESPDHAEQWLKMVIEKVNNEILSYSRQNVECSGMGTTLVTAICTNRFCTIANIGDSRCYIYNESGFQQLTEDHSLVNELVKSGEITKEDAEHHPRKNVLVRALGTEEKVVADYRTITFEEGDFLLLCSDGLSNKVSETEMERILTSQLSLTEKAESFVSLANENGGEDNITIVLLEQAAEHESG